MKNKFSDLKNGEAGFRNIIRYDNIPLDHFHPAGERDKLHYFRLFSLFLHKATYMTSLISEGIKVSVETYYQPDYSNPLQSEFMFAYRIRIENHNSFPVKLHRRHWHIFDSNGSNREVEGEGVVGVQPTLNPGENYQYVSGCNLRTEMGRMHGTYQMENLHSKKLFEVSIPSFEMIVPFKNN